MNIHPPTLTSNTPPISAQIKAILDAMMRLLLLPFFIFILLVKSSSTAVALLVNKLLPHRLPIISLLILVASVLILTTSTPTPPKDISNSITKTELIKQKTKLETLLSQQPTHRDILLNLAQINKILGDKTQAQHYSNLAQEIDPNY